VHPERLPAYEKSVLGRGTEAHTLEEADIANASGIIAATGDDIDNLSIIMTALTLNKGLFTVARQDRRQHDELFDSLGADLVARRSLIVARRILSIVTTPLLRPFIDHLVRADESFAQRTAARLEDVLRGRAPRIWVFELKDEIESNLRFVQRRAGHVRLEHILSNSRSEENELLPCVCLMLERGAGRIFLPESDSELQAGDRLLFAGRGQAHREITWTLVDSHSLLRNITGRYLPRGAVWRWLSGRS
jgi:Trk K+ transport system NAD-binding subunit